ncbi:MAG: carboxypeptidase regulatory-like domain-containing protein [Acidobacteria bacterium]|nr:MAG: carboxypeptidase regulatory-like domain-containing protein [Acidobacteriota bacterium]
MTSSSTRRSGARRPRARPSRRARRRRCLGTSLLALLLLGGTTPAFEEAPAAPGELVVFVSLRDSGGGMHPLQAVPVILESRPPGRLAAERRTDGAGAARFGRVLPGEYRLEIRVPGCPEPERREITVGAPPVPVRIVLGPFGELRVRVFDSERNPVPGAIVRVEGDATVRAERTGEWGRARFACLPPAVPLSVTVALPGVAPARAGPVRIEAGGARTVTVRFPPERGFTVLPALLRRPFRPHAGRVHGPARGAGRSRRERHRAPCRGTAARRAFPESPRGPLHRPSPFGPAHPPAREPAAKDPAKAMRGVTELAARAFQRC